MLRSKTLFLVVFIAAVAFAAESKQVKKFNNFEYPFAGADGWPHQFEWQNMKVTDRVTLVNGRWNDPDSDSGGRFSGLTLESVRSVDVTGDGQAEAIVVLRYDTGGTQYSHYVYIFSLRANSPVLLAYFHSGDRAYFGLSKVYGEKPI